MSSARPWGHLSSHDLDFASIDSAMGHGADLALGIALARPGRRVVCLNGDGSMLMTLGTLATIVGAAPMNLVLFVCDNGTFEITGNQPVAGAGCIDHAALAEAAGFRNVFRFDDARDYVESLPEVLRALGPTFVHVLVKPGDEGPISRGPSEEVPYLRPSLADSARALRAALARR
jgi:thiamine pyrophosphate-dependent acetolactate synthase large subunit-like protein